MKINQHSIIRLLNGSTDVVIYGMESCRYIEVSDALSVLNYKVHTACDYQLPLPIPLFLNRERRSENGKLIIGDECKHILVNLMAENYRRAKQGLMIVPLLFCIGFEDDVRREELNINRIFISSNSITNKELRRCYRLYAEAAPEIRSVVKQTFKFVYVKKNPSHSEDYILEQVPPFWESDDFKQKWQARISDPNRPSQLRYFANPKKHKWTDELQSVVKFFNHDSGKSSVNERSVEKQPGLRSKL